LIGGGIRQKRRLSIPQNDTDALVFAVSTCSFDCVQLLVKAGSKLDAWEHVREIDMYARIYSFPAHFLATVRDGAYMDADTGFPQRFPF
jgi:hypothetical protein